MEIYAILRKPTFISTFIALGISGCAIHPIPDDVTLDTLEIAQKIECEAYEAIEAVLARLLLRSESEETRQLGQELLDGTTRLFELKAGDRARIDEKTISIMDSFEDTAIALGFRLKITEENDNSGPVTFTLPFSNGFFLESWRRSEIETIEYSSLHCVSRVVISYCQQNLLKIYFRYY